MGRKTSAAAAAARPSSWILSPGSDLLLFVGTPILILPAVLLLDGSWGTEALYLFVASFGALGHHLPGMMRAYGDKALFQRFKARFLFAPIFLLATCIPLAFHQKSVLILVVYFWGMWHGFMQMHGFARIYDAKWKSFAPRTVALDRAVGLFGFAGALVFSDPRINMLLDNWYRAGGPLVQPELIGTMRWIFGGVFTAVLLAYVVNAWQCQRRGAPQSPVKHLLLATTIGFFWVANVVIASPLLAVVLFEIFHDVQYLTIVWLFNRKRAQAADVGAFTKFLFRRSTGLVALYVGLVFAYGGFNLLQELVLKPPVHTIMAGVLAASGLLHFYYDGFIWKVKEKSTREALGLEGGVDAGGPKNRLPAWSLHGLRWAVFVVPVLAFAVAAAPQAREEDELVLALAESLPESAEVQRNRAIALYQRDELDDAIVAGRRAAELFEDPQKRNKARADLAAMLYQSALDELASFDREQAGELLREAAALRPTLADEAHAEGLSLAKQSGQVGEATRRFEAAVLLDPSHVDARLDLAISAARAKRYDLAQEHAEEAARLAPNDPRPADLLQRLARVR
ncbi:MAG: tetratricopeptide repeat protein [Acidobacteriota bacterium]